jgi:hypothetical protein
VIDDKRDEEDEDGLDEEDEDEDEDDEDEEGEEEDGLPRIELERAKAYKKTMSQLETFYREISVISNKKPDSPLNKFKLGLLNETLEKANVILGDEFRPYPGFKTFDEANMPTASDVVLVVSHYTDGLRALRERYCVGIHWRVVGKDDFDEDE